MLKRSLSEFNKFINIELLFNRC